MATNYQKGRNLEYYVKRKFEEAGFYVIRSAGSHGIFDLVAIKDGISIGIQCKKGKISKFYEEIVECGEKFGIFPILVFSTDGKVFVKLPTSIEEDVPLSFFLKRWRWYLEKSFSCLFGNRRQCTTRTLG